MLLTYTKSFHFKVNKLNDDLKKRESENNKLTSDKEKLEAYTKKALHNVQEKVPPPSSSYCSLYTAIIPLYSPPLHCSICWLSRRAKNN